METNEVQERLESILDKIDRILVIVEGNDNMDIEPTIAPEVLRLLDKMDDAVTSLEIVFDPDYKMDRNNAYVLEYLDKKGIEF